MHRAWWNATIKQCWGRRRRRRRRTGRNFWNGTTGFCFFLLYQGNRSRNTTPLSPDCSLIIPSTGGEGALENARQMQLPWLLLVFLFLFIFLSLHTGARPRTWKNPHGTIKLILSSSFFSICSQIPDPTFLLQTHRA